MRCCILVIATLVLSGCPSSGVPDPDRCQPGSANGVDSLEIGPGGRDSDDTSSFVAYHDGSDGDFAIGGQGFQMLRLRIRVKGAGAPACLAQQTGVSAGVPGPFGDIGSDRVPRATYLQPDGSRVTRAMYIVLENGGPGSGELETRVTTAVGGRTISVVLGGNGEGLDAGIPDAGGPGTHD